MSEKIGRTLMLDEETIKRIAKVAKERNTDFNIVIEDLINIGLNRPKELDISDETYQKLLDYRNGKFYSDGDKVSLATDGLSVNDVLNLLMTMTTNQEMRKLFREWQDSAFAKITSAEGVRKAVRKS